MLSTAIYIHCELFKYYVCLLHHLDRAASTIPDLCCPVFNFLFFSAYIWQELCFHWSREVLAYADRAEYLSSHLSSINFQVIESSISELGDIYFLNSSVVNLGGVFNSLRSCGYRMWPSGDSTSTIWIYMMMMLDIYSNSSKLWFDSNIALAKQHTCYTMLLDIYV